MHLSDLPHLDNLNLSGTQVTDAGLVYLQELPRLRYIYVDNTQVTSEGLEEFKSNLPNSREEQSLAESNNE